MQIVNISLHTVSLQINVVKSVNGINVNSRLLAIHTLIKPVARQDVSFCVDPRQTPMATGEFLGFIEKASHFFQPSIARALLKVCSHSSPIPLPFVLRKYMGYAQK